MTSPYLQQPIRDKEAAYQAFEARCLARRDARDEARIQAYVVQFAGAYDNFTTAAQADAERDRLAAHLAHTIRLMNRSVICPGPAMDEQRQTIALVRIAAAKREQLREGVRRDALGEHLVPSEPSRGHDPAAAHSLNCSGLTDIFAKMRRASEW
jgi:hypothetical protein